LIVDKADITDHHIPIIEERQWEKNATNNAIVHVRYHPNSGSVEQARPI